MAFAFSAILRTAVLVMGVSAGFARADLALNISDTGYDPIPAGGEITYAVRIANSGNLRAPADTVTFSIPADTVYRGVTGDLQNCSPAPEITGPASVTCVVPSLAPRGVISGGVILRAQDAGIVTISGELNTAGVTETESTTITQGADLSLALTGPAVVQAGGYVTLTATVTNLGPYSANGGQFQMSLPTGFSASAVVLPPGCTIAGTLITCTLPGPIAVDGVVSLDFTTQVITANESSISVAGSIRPLSPPDPNLSNDTDTTLIRINPGTDVSLGKSRSPAGLLFTGDQVTFTLTPRHAGNAPLNAAITDTVPANYTVTGVSAAGAGWSCPAPVGNQVNCSYASAVANAAAYNAPITITATANTPTAPGSPVVNTATISSTTDVIPDNNLASDGGTDIALPQTDLIARKSGPPYSLMVVGNQYDWQIWTENDGNVPFLGRLIFTERLPAGLRADAIITPAGLGWTCDFTPPVTGPQTIVCQTDYYMTNPLPVGGRTQSLAVRTTVLTEGSIVNGLTVGYSDENYDDRDLTNNTVYTGGTAGDGPRIADLTIAKRVTSTGPYVSGDPVSFAIEIINTGPSEALDVVVLDRLQDLYFADSTTTATTLDNVPAGMSCNVTRGAAFYSDLRCDLATLPVCVAGVSCPVLQLTVLAGGDGAKVNTAQTYSTTTPDPGYGNNEATAGYTITPRTDVTVEKTASHPDGAALPAGQQIIYTIAAIVPGTGLSRAENVQIVDSLPAGLRIISVTPGQGSCTPVTGITNGLTTASSTVTCAIGTVLNGSRQSVTIIAVPATTTTNSQLTNRVAITTTTPEIDTTNNDDEITHNILPPALDLVINKTDSKDPLELNDATVYTITVGNTGPSEAFSLVITDTLPGPGMRLDAIRSLTPGLSCSPQGGAAIGSAGGQVVCTLGHLSVGASASFEVEMTGTVRGRWTNSARVTSAEAAYDPQANNTASQATAVYERARLRVTKSASEATPDVQEGFDWIVTVLNQPGIGIGLAEEVVLRDSLPANMIITGPPVPTAGTCDGQTGGRDVICILPDLAAGESVTIRIPARATTVSANPQPFSNTATVETVSFDEATEHSASAAVNVLSTSVSGTIWRDFNEDSARNLPQDAGVAAITVTLNGRDLLNNRVTRTVVTNSAGAYSFALLPPGTYDVTYTLPGGTTYTVGAALPTGIGGGTGGPGLRTITGITTTTANPAVSKDFTLIPVPQIALAKQVATPAIQPDGSYRVTYTLRLRNNSLEPVNGVQLRDILQPNFGTFVTGVPQPGEYSVISTTPSGTGVSLSVNPGFTGQSETLLVSSGTIPAQTTATLVLVLHVNPTVPRPGPTLVLTNNASSAATGQWSGRALSDLSNNGATPLPGQQSATSVTITFRPAIEIIKSADITGLSNPPQPGEWIDYTFTVRNTGDSPLLNVTVTDPMQDLLGPTGTPVPLLGRGASTAPGQVTARYQLKQSDLETGRVTNTARAVGEWAVPAVAGGPRRTVTDTDTATVATLARPGLTVVKSRVSDTIQNPTRVGDTIRYSFVITNTGNVSIYGLVLSDILTGVTPDPAGSFTIGTLPPATVGQNSVTVYANYTVTQDDIDAGVVVNTATAGGTYTTAGLAITAASNEVRVPLHQLNLMRVTKVPTTVPAVPVPGNTVTWTLSVENLGNTRLRIGTITEPLARTTVSAPAIAVLDPGQSTTATATHTLDQAEIDAGEVINQVTVAGTVPVSGTTFPVTPSGNDPVTPNTDPTVTPLPAHPSIALLKELITDTSTAMMPGDPISFRFTIRNTGNVTLDAITLTDDLAGVTLDVAALAGLRLAPGASVVATGSYALLPADIEAGGLTNTARVDATDPHDTDVSDISGTGFGNDDPTPVPLLRNPAVTLVKTITSAPAAPVQAGGLVRYAFEIRNSGNVALRDVAITELVPGVTLQGARPTPLAVGATDSTSFTASYILTQDDIDAGLFTNEARVSAVATGPAGSDIPVTADADVDLSIAVAPALTIVKSADASGVQNPTVLNDRITYNFVITNTGNVTLTDVTVSDPLPGLSFTNGNTITRLAPGAANAVTLSATYAVDQDDIDLGRVENQASVTAGYFDPVTGGTATLPARPSNPVQVDLFQDAEIELTKRVTSTLPVPVLEGTPVTYGFTVTNAGNVTLTDVMVTEALAGATVAGGPVTLAPGAADSTSFTADYTIVQADIERGRLDNTADVTGTAPGGAQVDDTAGNTLPLPQEPGIELQKAGNISGFANPAAPVQGDEIRYSFTVTNTGNVILTGITLADAGLVFDAPIAPFTLLPGENRVFADVGGHVLTQSEVNSGSYTNTATTAGAWGAGGPVQGTVTDDDTVITALTPMPGIDLVKVIDLANSTLSTPPQAGDEVQYAFSVTNTGNVSLTGLTLTDPLPGIRITGSISQLDPGISDATSFTARYTLTQADVNAGTLVNQATVTGIWGVDAGGVPQTVSDLSGTTVGTDGDTVLPITRAPSLTVVKSAVPALQDPPRPDDVITYSFLVTNTGNVTLTAVQLTDPLPGLTFGPSGSLIATLEPGDAQAVTLTATHLVTQGEIEAGEVVNTATVEGIFTDPLTGAVTDVDTVSNTVTVPLRQLPELSVVKTAASAISTPAQPGEQITYTITVTNSGNVLMENVVVDDPLPRLSPGSFTIGNMVPGQVEVLTATYLIDQADIDAGVVENQAIATGDFGGTPETFPSGPDTTGPGVTLVPVPQEPGIALVKTADAAGVSDPAVVGEEIRYSFTITNTGNVTLRDVSVADPLPGLQPSSLTAGVLAPGASITVGPAIYQITQADITAGAVTNRALATGTFGPPGNPGTIDTPSVTDTGVDGPTVSPISGVPAIALVKALSPTLDPATLRLGSEVTWVFTVTNTGNVPLTSITLTETLAGATVSGGPISLVPGASDATSFTARYSVTQADLDAGFILNQAIVNGVFDDGSGVPRPVSDLSGSTITDDDPTRTPLTQLGLIDLVKLADISGLSTPPAAGDVIRYSFTVTNTGAVTLTNVVVTDPMPDLVLTGAAIPSLAPGASNATSFSASYRLTQADIDSGRAIENQALATGGYTDGSGNPQTVSDLSGTVTGTDDPTIVTPARVNGLTLVKTADTSAISTSAQVGEVITYSFTLTNTGNVTLTDVTVADPLPGLQFSGNPVASLAPGATAVVTARYALTEADIRAAERENTATASGTWVPATGAPVTVTSDPSTVRVPLGYPLIEFNITIGDLRDVNGDGIMGPGDQVLYRFEVINTGTVALNDVNLDLASLSLSLPGLVCQPITLAVGERAFLICTGNAYTITAADVTSGTITLSGDATGTSDAGIEVRDNSSAPAVTNLGMGGLTVEKLAGVETAMVGDLVPYTIRVTNSAAGVPVTLRLTDTLPQGFSYQEGTSELDGVPTAPAESGRRLELYPVTLAPGQVRVWTLKVRIGSSVRPGTHTNRVIATHPVTGVPLAPEATATIRVLADAVMQCATVLGRVFDDTDQNGDMSKHAEERGLPNVRLVAPNGVAITTDKHGRFNVPCAAMPRAIGSNFMLKLDERTLPAGYRMTTENPRVVRLTPGMITRMDFGATMAPLVRIDLAANAFTRNANGKDAMVPALEAGLRKMVAEIKDRTTMLRITYVLVRGEDEAQARRRLKLVEKQLRALWHGTGKYKLNIETLIQRAGEQ